MNLSNLFLWPLLFLLAVRAGIGNEFRESERSNSLGQTAVLEISNQGLKLLHHPACVYAIQRPAKRTPHQTSMEAVASQPVSPVALPAPATPSASSTIIGAPRTGVDAAALAALIAVVALLALAAAQPVLSNTHTQRVRTDAEAP